MVTINLKKSPYYIIGAVLSGEALMRGIPIAAKSLENVLGLQNPQNIETFGDVVDRGLSYAPEVVCAGAGAYILVKLYDLVSKNIISKFPELEISVGAKKGSSGNP